MILLHRSYIVKEAQLLAKLRQAEAKEKLEAARTTGTILEFTTTISGRFSKPVRYGSNTSRSSRIIFFIWISMKSLNAQYNRFNRKHGHRKPYYWDDEYFNQPNQPVVGVSWYDASAYARWINKRLPSENEWEWAEIVVV